MCDMINNFQSKVKEPSFLHVLSRTYINPIKLKYNFESDKH